MKLDWDFIGLAIIAAIFAVVGYFEGYRAGAKDVAHEVCQTYFTGYAIQQCKERVRLGEPVFNDIRQ